MSSEYHTCYKIEGPVDEIQRFAHILARVLRYRGDLYKDWWARKVPQKDWPRESCSHFEDIASTLLTEVNGDAIRDLPDGWQVLTFWIEQHSCPRFGPWRYLMKRYVPHAQWFYYVECLWDKVAYTNDVWKKYFWGDYVISVREDKGAYTKELEVIRKKLKQPRFYREWNEEYRVYTSYWQTRSLQHLFREALGLKRLAPVDVKATLAQKYWEWDTDYGFKIMYQPIERLEPDKPTPCDRCRRMHELELRNDWLDEKAYHLEQALRSFAWEVMEDSWASERLKMDAQKMENLVKDAEKCFTFSRFKIEAEEFF